LLFGNGAFFMWKMHMVSGMILVIVNIVA